MREIDISVVVINYNTVDMTLQCLRGIRRAMGEISHQIIVIDNASEDGSAEVIEETFPDIEIIKNKVNFGFGKAANQGIERAKGKYIIFVNSDIVIKDPPFQNIVDYMEGNLSVGILGAGLRYDNGAIQLSSWSYPNLFVEFIQRLLIYRVLGKLGWYSFLFSRYQKKARDVGWVSGAFMVCRKKMIGEVGGFDERFFMYYEDTDLCLRAKKMGWRVVYSPKISVIHSDARTRRLSPNKISIQARMSQYLYYKKNCGRLQTLLLRCVVIAVSMVKMVAGLIISGGNREKVSREILLINSMLLPPR